MTDRDRLAADLNASTPTFGDGQFSEAWWHEYADRLIALGWTRLDEERLARAMLADRLAHDPEGPFDGYEKRMIGRWAKRHAVLIAKAYREDTE